MEGGNVFIFYVRVTANLGRNEMKSHAYINIYIIIYISNAYEQIHIYHKIFNTYFVITII